MPSVSGSKNGDRTKGDAQGSSRRMDDLDPLIKNLSSEEYQVRAAAVASLAARGDEAAAKIVDELLRRRSEPHALSNFSDALTEIGKPAFGAILSGVERVSELHRPDDVYLLVTLAELLGWIDDRRAVHVLRQRLKDLHDRLRTSEEPLLRECCESGALRLRRILIDLGDRDGSDELLSLLGDGRRRAPSDLVDLLVRIGTKDALIPLARLHKVEEPVSFSGAQRICDAVREIAHREHVRIDDPLLKRARATERTTLARILSRGRGPA